MQKKYRIELAEDERAMLERLASSTKEAARKVLRAKMLLRLDESSQGEGWRINEVAEVYEVSVSTVLRIRQQWCQRGSEAVLSRKPYPKGLHRRFDGEQEAKLIALCCSEPPTGHARWSLRLLADKVVELQIVEQASYEGIRRILKKTRLSLGKSGSGV
jgi:transposase